MAAKPEYNVGDVVYLESSAAIGRLDAFKISGIKQTQQGRWVFRVDISKKPPHQQFIGDSYDGRTLESSIYYTAEELISHCDALDIMVAQLELQIQHVESQVAEVCDNDSLGDDPEPNPGDSKFSIGDRVFIDASARIGFFEPTMVTEVLVRPIQPGSPRFRYSYKLSFQGLSKPALEFRESEITTFCDAGTKILVALNLQLESATATRQQACGTN